MKPCRVCAWSMVRGGICQKCGHEDDEFPGIVVAVAFICAAVIGALVFVLLALVA